MQAMPDRSTGFGASIVYERFARLSPPRRWFEINPFRLKTLCHKTNHIRDETQYPEMGYFSREAAVSDDVLVRRCLKRDPDAVRDLVERFQADVFGMCFRMLSNRHDAEDVCQEVFLRIFRSLHRWDRQRPLRPWVMGITVNRCRTWLTQRAKRPELLAYLQDTAESRPHDESAELAREIEAAVNDLRPDYRAAFILFHEQGRPYDEIAQALDRPVGTIKTWLHRARTELLVRLRERGMIPDESPEDAPTLEDKPTPKP